jgi:predicted transcriptional regulator of viral defense system
MPSLNSLQEFASLPYFTIEGYKQAAGIDQDRSQSARVQLARWHKAGKILRIKRGVYVTRSFFDRHSSEPDFPAAISSIILPQSYVSSIFILQRTGILTEATYPITAVTLKNTRTITNDFGTFSYQHIDDRFYQGFSRHSYHGITFFQAHLAKALFDYLYLRPRSSYERRLSYNLAEELRLNLDRLPPEESASFEEMVTKSDSPKMQNVLNNIQRHIWQT